MRPFSLRIYTVKEFIMPNFNQSFLSPTEFRFTITRLPYTQFFVQSANIPGVQMDGESNFPTPFKTLHRHGDKMTYNNLTVTVRVDENMKVFKEIVDWIEGLTSPESFSQHDALNRSDDGLYSDATLTLFTNSKNPNIELQFKDVFPVSIGDIQMDLAQGTIEYATATIEFATNGYKIKTL
jgi:hypothetical protein